MQSEKICAKWNMLHLEYHYSIPEFRSQSISLKDKIIYFNVLFYFKVFFYHESVIYKKEIRE